MTTSKLDAIHQKEMTRAKKQDKVINAEILRRRKTLQQERKQSVEKNQIHDQEIQERQRL